MAKTSMIEREKRREKLVKQHAAKRAKLKEVIRSPKSTDAEREEAQRKLALMVGSSRVDLQACKLEYSIVSPK